MAGLGAKGDHFASRRETTVLNGLQVQHAIFLSQHKSILQCCWDILPLEDEVAVPESHPGCFTFRLERPSCLSSAPWSKKKVVVIRWCGLQFLVCCHTGQRGSHVSFHCHECSLACVYLNRDPDVLLSCYCSSPDAVSFPHLTTGAESRNLRVFSLQNETNHRQHKKTQI